eukprot:GFYU01066659.1.p2 GENE.GFYU01066659.1~~GFYU01066659.1.p2  ORF type:complete len:105 (+),score=2.65 GFYU01066659.1:117-431(+)
MVNYQHWLIRLMRLSTTSGPFPMQDYDLPPLLHYNNTTIYPINNTLCIMVEMPALHPDHYLDPHHPHPATNLLIIIVNWEPTFVSPSLPASRILITVNMRKCVL